MNYLVWAHAIDDKLCSLIPAENVENEFELRYGIPRAESWPTDALMRMNPEYKTSIRLSDALDNRSFLIVASKALKEFFERELEKEDVPTIEYLPVTIYNHKGRVASDEYFIVHQVGTEDCIDLDQSTLTWNLIKKDQISGISKLVLDESKIKPEAKLFRAEHLPHYVFIRRDLADKITAEEFTGTRFIGLDRFRVV